MTVICYVSCCMYRQLKFGWLWRNELYIEGFKGVVNFFFFGSYPYGQLSLVCECVAVLSWTFFSVNGIWTFFSVNLVFFFAASSLHQ